MPRSPIERAAELLPGSFSGSTGTARVVPSGWTGADGALFASGCDLARGDLARGDRLGGGLIRGGVHEWLGAGGASGSEGADWSPPLLLLAHLAGCAVRDALERDRPATVLWIGRRVWPYPRALFDHSRVVEGGVVEGGAVEGGAVGSESCAPAPPRADRPNALLALTLRLEERPGSSSAGSADRTPTDARGGLAAHSLFVDTGEDDGRRLWAIDTALRSPGVTAIVADGSRLGMAATRRLQLAAAASMERGGDAPLALLARPTGEAGEISAATTRWMVRRIARRSDRGTGTTAGSIGGSIGGSDSEPMWDVDLMRVKGAQVFRPSVSPAVSPAVLPSVSRTSPVAGIPVAPRGRTGVGQPDAGAALHVVEPDEVELRLGRTA